MNNTRTDNRHIALAGAAFRTVPNAYKALSTTELDLSSVTGTAGDTTANIDLRGCWVMIQNASGGDLTLLRGSTGMGAPSANVGKVIKDGTTEEFFVDPQSPDHFIRASGTGLVILFDTKLVGA